MSKRSKKPKKVKAIIKAKNKLQKVKKQRKPKEIKITEFDHSLVKKIAGEEAIKIVELLGIKKNVSEFVIAEKLDLTINRIRHILYKLQSKNLVTSTRKKDKKKGWYIYYWTFNFENLKELVSNLKKLRLMQLKSQLSKDTPQFYICENNCLMLKFKEALEYDFKCPECGKILYEIDSKKELENAKKEIEVLEEELKNLK